MFEIIAVILSIIGCIITMVAMDHFVINYIFNNTIRYKRSLKNALIETFGYITSISIMGGIFIFWVIIVLKIIGVM